MSMTNEELNTALYKKMFAQQEAFREELLQMPPEEILRHTYEYTVREDILLSFEYNDLPDQQAQALLQSKESLWDLFHTFEKIETGYMESIWQCVEDRASELLKRQQELYHSDIYPHNAAYARAHGELEQYRSSNKAMLACKQAIEEAVHKHYYDNTLHKEAVEQVMDAFSAERIAEVLAITCRHMDWDGRISDVNKAWAKSFPVCERQNGIGEDVNREFMIGQVHPGLIDIFTRQFRNTLAAQKQLEEKRPSVLAKLQRMSPAAADEKPKKDRAKNTMER